MFVDFFNNQARGGEAKKVKVDAKVAPKSPSGMLRERGRFRQNRLKRGIALAEVFLRQIDFSFEQNTFRIARF